MVLRSLALATPLAYPATAGDVWVADVWVDPTNGDDANGGTSAADAWRTVTHALIQPGPSAGPNSPAGAAWSSPAFLTLH